MPVTVIVILQNDKSLTQGSAQPSNLAVNIVAGHTKNIAHLAETCTETHLPIHMHRTADTETQNSDIAVTFQAFI